MKNSILFILLLTTIATQAQIVINGSWPNTYLIHKIKPKENMYSIGRIYNSSPSLHIAPFNNTTTSAILKDNEILKIPVNEFNFTQTGSNPDTMVLVPVSHIVAKQETLSKISSYYNNVNVANLKDWNKLVNDNIQVGQALTIGYLIVNPNLSSLASQKVNNIAFDVAEKAQNEPQTEEPEVGTVEQKAELPKMEEPKKVETPKPTVNKPDPTYTTSDNNAPGGFFGKWYTNNGIANAKSVKVGVFKTISGRSQQKYYVMMSGITPGTIVKLFNTANKKFIYAQVLAGLENETYNNGLNLRMSSTAIDALVLPDNDLYVLEISY
jgi:hypothetical protein